jgi:integrase
MKLVGRFQKPSRREEMTESSLYERLGGAFAIAAVIDHFSDAVVRNPIAGQESENPDNVARALRRAADKAGLNGEGLQPLGLHDLRHTFVGLALANRRLSLPEVVELARHANAGVTLTVYAGLVAGDRKAAVAKLVEAGFGS